MDEAIIRDLISHHEGSSLDFKEFDYNWNDPTTNAELAKDIIAIANSLAPNQEGFILVGVREGPDKTGELVGMSPAAHQDDANLHQRIYQKLSAVPTFEYRPVTVDGLSVGVYHIRAGGRPFYPVKDDKVLKRFVPLHRSGTSTDIASPRDVVQWYREDNAVLQRKLELEVLEMEEKRTPYIHLSVTFGQSDAKRRQALVGVKNIGHTAVVLRCLIYEYEGDVKATPLEIPVPSSQSAVLPGDDVLLEVILKSHEASRVLARPRNWTNQQWAGIRVHFCVECSSKEGVEGRQLASVTLS